MAEVVLLPDRVPSLGRAVEQFLAAKPLSPNARRSYAYCLGAVVSDLGAGTALADVTPERRPQVRDDTAPVRYEQLHALWTRADVHVREKTLWRMLYETAARTNEILALNIEDLDLGARRAVVRGKGGHRQEVVWASGTARLLPRYLGGRQRGPLFVTHRRPNQAPALCDVCPDTGRGRLSYQQAWALFRTASGWTLHQLRHSRAHPPRREGSSGTFVESEEPPPEPAQPRPVRTAGRQLACYPTGRSGCELGRLQWMCDDCTQPGDRCSTTSATQARPIVA